MAPWQPVVEEESFTPEFLAEQREAFERWSGPDLEWMVEHAHPDLEIRQPPDFMDARTYRGREGFLDAILDWPTQWEDFKFEPRRIFALDSEHVVVAALHSGRSRQIEVEVEGEVVWLLRWRSGLLVRWDMFMNVDDAVAAVRDVTR